MRTSVYIEEERNEVSEKTATDPEKETEKKLPKGAVIRLTLSDFFARLGKML